LDLISWYIKKRPAAVTGFSSTILYEDKRDVPDTVQAVIEYPGGGNLMFDATIANTFDSDYELIYGSDAAVMIRGGNVWMFKEPDSSLLGWEVYARKEAVFNETGIILKAGGSTSQKNLKGGDKNAAASDPFPFTPLYYALQTFAFNVGLISGAIADYIDNFKGGDKNAALDENEVKDLQTQLATLKIVAYPGWLDGFEATVTAIKANEAAVKKQRIALSDDLFKI
jgi:hypothetical protein